jgi:hypothetical protein
MHGGRWLQVVPALCLAAAAGSPELAARPTRSQHLPALLLLLLLVHGQLPRKAMPDLVRHQQPYRWVDKWSA